MEQSRFAPKSKTPPNGDGTLQPSAARGRETRTALLQKLRPPPLVHAWDFWYEKPIPSAASQLSSTSGKSKANDGLEKSVPLSTSASASTSTSTSMSTSTSNSAPDTTSTDTEASTTYPPSHPITTPHNTTLTHLHSITDVRHFWSLFNNFSFSSLPSRVSVHLFHSTIRPLWEDPRNTHGGSWTFRVPRDKASPFFRSLALLAIGEQLQEAVYDEKKISFKDDICGISMSVRGERSCNVSVWNRDGKHEAGKKRLLETILNTLPAEVKPADGTYYYKRHNEHVDFGTNEEKKVSMSEKSKDTNRKELEEARDRSHEVSEAVLNVEKEYEKVRKILEEVKLKDEEMDRKLAAEANKADIIETGTPLEATSRENEVDAGIVD